jgi:hypothetical protein
MNYILKRFLAVALVVGLTFTLAACGEKTVEPVVVDDVTIPVIVGAQDVAYTMEDPVPNYKGVMTASDDIDGDVTANLIVDSSKVDLTVAGSYVVTVTVKDEAGNEASETYNVVVSEKPLSFETLATMDVDSIDLDNSFYLKTRYANGTMVEWISSHPKVVTSGGFINRPAIGEDDVTVTLTANFTNGSYTITKTYDVFVEARVESVVTSSINVNFEGTSEEYVVEDKEGITVFFIDGTDIPYIDVETYLDMMNGAIESDELEYTVQNEDQLLVSYDAEFEDFDGQLVNETYSAVIDFGDNTFKVDSFDFFENYISSTESDYGEGLNYVDADYIDPHEVVIDLNAYKFDLIIHNDGEKDNYLMPFHIANLFFAGGIYYDAYFNGEMIYGIDTFGISDGGEDSDDLLEKVRTSSFNEAAMSTELKTASFNYMTLALDYFYGLKEDQEVTTYEDFMYQYADNYVTKTDTKLYKSLFQIAYDLNDLHTSHVLSGYYTQLDYTDLYLQASLTDLGDRVVDFYQGYWHVQDKYEDKYGSIEAMPTYELIDNEKTAIIHITGFDIDTPDSFEKTVAQLPVTVENVVVDLAYNTGGNLGAVLRIFGYMTEEQIMYHSQNPADGSGVTYYIESDSNAYEQYNWYVLCSEVTFSAANLMTSMAKELDITTIGHKSSGGASSIGVLITPDGSIIMMSTNNVLSTRIGDEVNGYEYKSIEFGVEPDITISDITSDEQLIAAIAEDQATVN